MDKSYKSKVKDEYVKKLLDVQKLSKAKELFSGSVVPVDYQSRIYSFLPKLFEEYLNKQISFVDKKKNPNYDLCLPTWTAKHLTFNDGEVGYEYLVGIRTGGCEYARCLSCELHADALKAPVPGNFQIEQFKHALKNLPKNAVDIFLPSDGSFLNDSETPEEARKNIALITANLKNIKNLIIESRPEYITQKKLKDLVQVLRPDQQLYVILGLETSDPFIPKVCINKGYGTSELEEKVPEIHKAGAGLIINCFIKPAFITEREAIEHSINTGKYLFDLPKRLGIKDLKKRIILQRTFSQKDGFLTFLEEKGYFRHLWEWTVVEVIRNLGKITDGTYIHIDTEEDFPPPLVSVHNRDDKGNICTCNYGIKEAIENFNMHQNINLLNSELPECDCRKIWEEEIDLRV